MLVLCKGQQLLAGERMGWAKVLVWYATVRHSKQPVASQLHAECRLLAIRIWKAATGMLLPC
jgi:hypothetical protein